MSRPFKHPKTGVYYFRKVVPDDLRAVVGKTEEKHSLGTKDPDEAKRRFSLKAEEVARKWDNLRKGGPRRLTQREIIAIAGEFYREFVGILPNEPGPTKIWDEVIKLQQRVLDKGALDRWIGPDLDAYLERKGLVIDRAPVPTPAPKAKPANPLIIQVAEPPPTDTTSSYGRLLQAIHDAHMQAAGVHRKRSMGDYSPDPKAERFPPPMDWGVSETSSTPRSAGALTITGLFEGWRQERTAAPRVGAEDYRVSPSTVENYRNTINKLVGFLGHDDALRVTKDDIVAFKDMRLQKVSRKTVKDGDLAALNSVFGWGVSNTALPSNPAAGVRLKVGKPKRTRERGFTDKEAAELLEEAWTRVPHPREGKKMSAAKKWVPFLCAYCGARVGEMVQLRREDVYQQGGVWVVKVTPEAGPVKNRRYRIFPLHEHLVELGFPGYVAEAQGRYLFLSPDAKGDIQNSLNTTKNRLREQARETVDDDKVQPNHGWRHRFKTVARNKGADVEVVKAIIGHEGDSVSEGYGDYTIEAMVRALSLFPRIWSPEA